MDIQKEKLTNHQDVDVLYEFPWKYTNQFILGELTLDDTVQAIINNLEEQLERLMIGG